MKGKSGGKPERNGTEAETLEADKMFQFRPKKQNKNNKLHLREE